MSGSDAKKLSGKSKPWLVERVKELEGQIESEVASSAPLWEIRSKVRYTQFFPRPEGKDDVAVPPLGTSPLPEDMLHDKHLRRAIEDGKLTDPYKVEAYSLPPKQLDIPADLELTNPTEKQAVQNILEGNEVGRALVTTPIPKTRKGRINKLVIENTVLPIFRLVRWIDEQTHEMPDDLRETLHERIEALQDLV